MQGGIPGKDSNRTRGKGKGPLPTQRRPRSLKGLEAANVSPPLRELPEPRCSPSSPSSTQAGNKVF